MAGRLYDLLGAVLQFAPNGTVQQAITNTHRSMQAAGESEKEIALTLANILADGLGHGNWSQ